jgi:hypothetical protein
MVRRMIATISEEVCCAGARSGEPSDFLFITNDNDFTTQNGYQVAPPQGCERS